MTIREIRQYMAEKDKILRSDKDFNEGIYIKIIDGSEYRIYDVEVEEMGDYVLVWPEHHPFFLNHKDEIIVWYYLNVANRDIE